MVRAGNDHDRQFLWPRPVEHFRECHGLVALAVDDDRVAGYGLRRKAADRDAHQHHAQGARALSDLRLNRRAERESRQDERQRAEGFLRILGDAEQVFGLSSAFVVPAF